MRSGAFENNEGHSLERSDRLAMHKLLKSPFPGLVVMVAGIAWNAISNDWKPRYVYVGGSLYAIAALFIENWTLKEARKPKLRLVFDQDRGAPFVRDKPLYHKDGEPAGTLRIFSVGITNGGETAHSVSVKVVQIQPSELKANWTSSLHVANESVEMSQRDIHQSTMPLAFFEVASQAFEGNRPSTSLRVRFATASLFERRLALADKYFVTLAIDGARAEPPKRFAVQRNTKGRYEMRIAI
jgi:hypothetical protein